jgi:thioredoxin reductase
MESADPISKNHYEFLVIGAGPAGVQASMFFEEKGVDYLMIDKNDNVGSHWRSFPRHRDLISINKKFTGNDNADFNLRHDWNSFLSSEDDPLLFTDFSDELYPNADDLLRYMEQIQERHQLNGLFNTEVKYITKDDEGHFVVTTSNGRTFTGKYLFMATGGRPWRPKISGLELPQVDFYETVSLDKSEFENKRVLILGKGNSAFETAEHLAGTAAVVHLVSPTQITFAWNTHYVGNLRAVRNNILDMYQLKSQHAILNGTISKIEYRAGDDHPLKVKFVFSYTPDDPYHEVAYDRVIACCGFQYVDISLFDLEKVPVTVDPRPELRGKFPKITPGWQYEGVPNMYAIGAMMQTVNFHKNAAGFIHGFRYSIRTLINILMEKDRGMPLPQKKVEFDAEAIASFLLERMNTSSALYQMYNELCDVVVAPGEGETEATYYYELPLEYVKKKFAGQRYIAFVFDFGSRGDVDAFKYILEATPEAPEKSIFLHPILHAFDEQGNMTGTRHLLENIETEWHDEKLHLQPIQKFVRDVFFHHGEESEADMDTVFTKAG